MSINCTSTSSSLATLAQAESLSARRVPVGRRKKCLVGGGRSRIKSHLADYCAAKNHTSPYYIYTAATINPMAAAMLCACPLPFSACGAGHTLLSSKEKGSCGAVALME